MGAVECGFGCTTIAPRASPSSSYEEEPSALQNHVIIMLELLYALGSIIGQAQTALAIFVTTLRVSKRG